ncbi:snoaL-like domain protein [Mycobacterium xenopi 4042]|uniref:SnoaL-like domain protein n=1 Tax=Mycobacterium xenopi 4042 TaxID=1299334 RepID=X7Z9B6_MYCXE|nr:snoaL-like domain protein [Mycobacterium xenopi 4042]
MTTSEIATVLAWHDALNAADLDTLVALSSEDIEIGDAHGAGQGHEALREWAAATKTTAEPGRMYVRDGVVVVEQKISSPDNPARRGLPRQHSGSSTITSLRCSVTTIWRRRWRPPNSPRPTWSTEELTMRGIILAGARARGCIRSPWV